jgi:cell division protein FtsB
VETCDETSAQENDQLKLEVKTLEQMISELVKQAKVRPSQDNRINMVNKLEKGSNVTKQALSKLLNNQTRLNLSRSNKRLLKRKWLSMQGVHT